MALENVRVVEMVPVDPVTLRDLIDGGDFITLQGDIDQRAKAIVREAGRPHASEPSIEVEPLSITEHILEYIIVADSTLRNRYVARRHGGRFSSCLLRLAPEVLSADAVAAKEHLERAVALARPQADRMALEGEADEQAAIVQADAPPSLTGRTGKPAVSAGAKIPQ